MRIIPIVGFGTVAVVGCLGLASGPTVDLSRPNLADWRTLHVGRLIPEFNFTTLTGVKSSLSKLDKGKGLAIVITSATCPISGKYTQTYRRFEQTCAAQGINVLFVNPVEADTAAQMKIQAANFKSPYAVDRTAAIASTLGAKTTTELFILDASKTLVYRGAIDDQYGLGYSKEAPSHNYGEDAIRDMLKGVRPEVPATSAPGCALAVNLKAVLPMSATYHNRISRIFATNCLSCHHKGGSAPFSLETLTDARSRSAVIKAAVESKRMPPWFAKPDENQTESRWKNDRSLTAEDKSALYSWIDHGMPAGNPKYAPAPMKPPGDWSIGTPDAVVQIPQPVAVKAEGVMDYVRLEVPTNFGEDKWVTAMQIRPTARQVVHHVLVFVIKPGEKTNRDEDGVLSYFAGYVPGNDTYVMPPGFAKKLPAGSRLQFQIHYTPNGTAAQDQVRLGMVFAKSAPKKEVKTFALANTQINIPPGDGNHMETADVTLPFTAKIFSFMPHMHLRGKAYRYEAILPTGEREVLLDVPRYDFNWQLSYDLREPLVLPKGTRLIGTAWYNNSDTNPANPNSKLRVFWGDQTFNEMMLGYLVYSKED